MNGLISEPIKGLSSLVKTFLTKPSSGKYGKAKC